MNNTIEKNAQVMSDHLANGDFGAFKVGFDEASGGYIRTKVREGSFAEKILPPKTVTMDDKDVQKDLNSDTAVYVMEIEPDAVAMSVGFRAEDQPVFVDGERMAIKIGKIESEPTKKPQMELLVANDIVKMLNKNNAEAIARVQDTAFLKLCNAAVEAETEAQVVHADTTNAITRLVLTKTMNIITGAELVPDKWLMSDREWNKLLASPLSEIDNLAGVIFKDGLQEKRLLGLPVETSVKSTLFTADENGSIYLFAAPEFLGKIIKIGTDKMWSKWERDIFHWTSWRYIGMGFGDTRGIARLDLSTA
jgi:hypothetical protein